MLTSRLKGGRPVTSASPRRMTPAGRQLEAADHAQGGRLAAAGGAEHREELAAVDLEREVVDRGDVMEAFGDSLEMDVDLCHSVPSGWEAAGDEPYRVCSRLLDVARSIRVPIPAPVNGNPYQRGQGSTQPDHFTRSSSVPAWHSR